MDERVRAATAHWGPRFVANGVPLGDFTDVTASVERWEDWCDAWSARGLVHEQLGRAALDEGHGRSAGEHLVTAAVCYHFGKFLFVHDRERQRAAHRSAVTCHGLALEHLDPPGERVTIPFEGRLLPGVLRRPRGTARPGVVVLLSGLDSAKEEMGAYESPFLERGLATLSVDGPGQGEMEEDLPIRGDWEVPVAAILDWLEGRDDVDPERVGLWGVSLGGYYAPRAAAFEPRLRGCIALSGPYDFSAHWDDLPVLTREAFRVRSGLSDDEAARRHAATLSLEGIAGKIACPLFVVAGRADRLLPWQDAERLAAEATGPTTLLVVEDGNHVVNNVPYRYRPQTADWMAEILA